MKLISWNVNGLRACMQKGFMEQFQQLDADFFCLQETKLQKGQIDLKLPGYEQYWCYAEKKGYSGTAIFTKHTPLSVSYGLGVPELDNEGRLITLEYPEFYLVTCYTPNAQRGLARIEHRMRWDAAFRSYIGRLDQEKPVILCGDLNVAHKEIDLKNPGSNRGNAGFSDEERDSFTKTLDLGFTDTFRYLHPDAKGAYTWWSYMFHARENNAGWRIDYFLVSDRIRDTVYKTPIYPDIMGSDHCPVGLELDIKCNGGIWSPECIDLDPPKEKEKAPEKEKAAPALKAGAIAIGVICLLVVCGLLFNHFLPQQQTEDATGLIAVEVYKTPIKVENLVMGSRQGSLFLEGENKWLVSGNYFEFEDTLSGRPINFWIKIEMTDLGREELLWTTRINVSCDPEATNDTQQGIFHNESHAVMSGSFTEDIITEDSSVGWFVYGFIPTDTLITLKFHHKSSPDGSYTYQVSVSPYTGPDTPNSLLVESCIQNAAVLDAYITAENLKLFGIAYQQLREYSDALTLLEYRGYEAAQLLFEQFVNNKDKLQRNVAEALLSLNVYFYQLTPEQQDYFLQNCEYHKDERFMDVDLIG